MPYPEGIAEQSKELYCLDHDLFFVKNVMGQFVCPFCESSVPDV